MNGSLWTNVRRTEVLDERKSVDERKSDDGRSLQQRWQCYHSECCNATMALLLQRSEGVATLRRDGGAGCATLVELAARRWWN
jgi:hypothetical protein